MNKDKKTVIFDLDGTLADITSRRILSTKDNGKMDWDTFFNPKNIKLDLPNTPVIKMAQMLDSQGFNIVIFSGRSTKTRTATKHWLKTHNVPFSDIDLHMRSTHKDWHFMKDSDLKQIWLDSVVDKDDVFAVFDDRNQVVDMWRSNGLTCFQVADGDF